MNDDTVKLVETIAQMETTELIASHFEKVLAEISNTNGTCEIVACVIIAAIRAGKMSFKMLDVQ